MIDSMLSPSKKPIVPFKIIRGPRIAQTEKTHVDRRKKPPKHKTKWDRLDNLYQD